MPYTIQRNDTLSGLAQQHSTSVDELMRLNPQIKHRDHIEAGASLNLPEQQQTQQTGRTQEDLMRVLTKLRDRMTGVDTRVDALDSPTLRMPDATSDITPAQKVQDMTAAQRLAEDQVRIQQEMEEYKAARDTAMEERRDWKDKIGDFFDKRQTLEDKTREEMQRMGVHETNAKISTQIDQIMATQTHLNELVAQRDGALGALGQQAIATPFLTGQQARVAQAYDSRINALSAKMGAETAYLQAQQGQLQNAMSMVGQIVDAYTYDTQMELQKYSMFLDLNREEIDMMDTEYKNALNEQQRYWENRYQEERQEREQVMEWYLTYPDAGIAFSDSREEAAEKLANWIGVQPDAEVQDLVRQNPGAFVGMTQEEVEGLTFMEAIGKIAEMTRVPEYELRTLGRDLVQVDPQTGETRVLARGAEATPQSYREWQLAGSPGTFGSWLEKRTSPSPAMPTIYGLTKDQTQDVLFSEQPTPWFVEQVSPYIERDHDELFEAYKRGEAPIDRQQEIQRYWDNYRETAIETHKEIRELLQPEDSFMKLLETSEQ